MKMSKLYIPTLREVPADTTIISHRLLLRAGFIRKMAGGMYSYLPLAWKVLRKIEEIIREEMNKEEAQEILMPIIQSAEIWEKSGRWNVYGEEMFRLKDRNGRQFCLGPTHEELITTLIKNDIHSYKQLPFIFYQIQNKYRDEIRPRFGLIRSREFIMKDAYSFDKDEDELDITYQKMSNAYTRIFKRCGLNFHIVQADSGAIGGTGSHEFMAIAKEGEVSIFYCEKCGYAASEEKAEVNSSQKKLSNENIELKEKSIVDTGKASTIDEVSSLLKIAKNKIIKALTYKTEKGEIIALVRGDHRLNETKLKNALNCTQIEVANQILINNKMESMYSCIGPISTKNIKIVADNSVMSIKNGVCGSNVKGKYYINVSPIRDFKANIICDLRLMQRGDECPHCTEKIGAAKGIEVGQIFKLGTKYSKELEATYPAVTDESKLILMGCYGIGVSRTMAAVVEQLSDENGINWPVSIAPYHCVIIPISFKDKKHKKLAESLYTKFIALGIETILDDRDERPGVKFNDADLIGYPLKIIVGNKSVNENLVEIKERKAGKIHLVKIGMTAKYIRKLLQNI